MYAPSQWETMLQCNIVSHWLGAFTKLSLLVATFMDITINDIIIHGFYKKKWYHNSWPFSQVVPLFMDIITSGSRFSGWTELCMVIALCGTIMARQSLRQKCYTPFLRQTLSWWFCAMETPTTLLGNILCMRPANERRRHNVSSFIGRAHSQNDPCITGLLWWQYTHWWILLTKGQWRGTLTFCCQPEPVVEQSSSCQWFDVSSISWCTECVLCFVVVRYELIACNY